MAPKIKSDELDAEETMPNFLYNLEEASAGDLMPAIKEIYDNHMLPAGPAGVADNPKFQSNEHLGIKMPNYSNMPSLET